MWCDMYNILQLGKFQYIYMYYMTLIIWCVMDFLKMTLKSTRPAFWMHFISFVHTMLRVPLPKMTKNEIISSITILKSLILDCLFLILGCFNFFKCYFNFENKPISLHSIFLRCENLLSLLKMKYAWWKQ